METPIGTWLSQLVLTHLDELAQEMATEARRTMPIYRAMEPEVVHPLFAALYQVLAQSFAVGDTAPLRAYLERVTADRMRDGASADGFIKLAELSQQGLLRLIRQELPQDPERAADAIRIAQNMNNNARLMLSEINLRLINRRGGTRPLQS
ncbi:MAG TPA: hypothetical protein VFM49_22255 [Chloroflexia bacterium]|jgi:hypothetical protein|nr:hypothetical protein [Chloroflexia bacterium]